MELSSVLLETNTNLSVHSFAIRDMPYKENQKVSVKMTAMAMKTANGHHQRQLAVVSIALKLYLYQFARRRVENTK